MHRIGKDALPSAVSVFCRVRPFGKRDEEHTASVVKTRTDFKTVVLSHAGELHNFAFDRVFNLDSSQQDVFDGVKVAESVCDVLGGYNATIFAYGQTASGKTHTMEGINVFDPVTRGIIPRSAAALFLACSEAPSDIEFAIKVSFVEIYMERIRDLLDSFGQKKKKPTNT
jgi:kinesin family protein 5